MTNEAQIEAFRALAKRYEMSGHHFHKDKRGFLIVTRQGIDYLVGKLGIVVEFQPVFQWSDPAEGRYVMTAHARIGDRGVMTFGEASPKNNTNAYPVAMAEKRAMSRAVLKLVGMYELGAMGEDEA
jgi:hypothetical protein